MRTVRDGLRWHLIESRPGVYDFDSVLPMLAAARQTGTQVIWDVLHYGWPDDLDIFSDAFVRRFAEFSRACAEVLSRETDGPPVSSRSTKSRSSRGQAGTSGSSIHLPLDAVTSSSCSSCERPSPAIRSMWEVNPQIRIVHTEPMINVVPHPDRPEDAGAAEAHRQAQYTALDIIAGRARPEFGGREDYLDVIGINYYVHNQWIYPGGHGAMLEPSHPQVPTRVADAPGSVRAVSSAAVHRRDRDRRSGAPRVAAIYGLRSAPGDSVRACRSTDCASTRL